MTKIYYRCPKCRKMFAWVCTCGGDVSEDRCDHIPMKAAIDDQIGCIKCGKWLGKAQ